jgi:uncharacterized membrane protein
MDPDTWRIAANIPLRPQETQFTFFGNTALYSAVPYLPQAFGIALSNLLNLPPLYAMYAGRLCNLLAWLGLVYLAIRIAPAFKWVLALLALTPMSIHLAGSLSADPVTYGLAYLLLATVLHHALRAEPTTMPTGRSIAYVATLAVLVTLCKSAYVVLAALVAMIPPSRFGSSWRYLGSVAAVLAVAAVVLAWWTAMVNHLFIPRYSPEPAPPVSQLAYIMGHPLIFLNAIADTLLLNYQDYWRMFIGRLGWLDTPLPHWLTASYSIVLVGAALLDHRPGLELVVWQKAGLAVVASSTVLLMYTALYLQWNTVGSPIIEGVQGRYLIPVAPLVLLLLYNHRLQISAPGAVVATAVGLFTGLALVQSLYILVLRYYVHSGSTVL